MAAPKGSKGKATPPPAEGGGAAPPASAEPTDGLKMEWLAIIRRVPGNWTFSGLSISFPNVEDALTRMGSHAEGHNVLFVPWPKELGDALAKRWPDAVKLVKGRLPELKLWPQGEGNNYERWGDYLAAHPARSANTDLRRFRQETISLPKD